MTEFDSKRYELIGRYLLIDIRKRKKVSVEHIAAILGKSKQYIYDIENGNRSFSFSVDNTVFEYFGYHYNSSEELLKKAIKDAYSVINSFLLQDDKYMQSVELFLLNTDYVFSDAFPFYLAIELFQYTKTGNMNKRKNYIIQCLSQIIEHDLYNETELISFVLGFYYFKFKNYKKAINYFEKVKAAEYEISLSNDKENSLEGLIGLNLYYLGLALYKDNKAKEASIQYTIQAREHFMEGGYIKRVIWCNNALANYYIEQKNYIHAVNLGLATLSICEQINFQRGTQQIVENLGYYYLFTGDFRKSIHYSIKSLNENNSANSYINLCYAYLFEGNYDKAKLYFEKIPKTDDERKEVLSHLNCCFNTNSYQSIIQLKEMLERSYNLRNQNDPSGDTILFIMFILKRLKDEKLYKEYIELKEKTGF